MNMPPKRRGRKVPPGRPSSSGAPALQIKTRQRPTQFWLEQSDTRDSWFGMYDAKTEKPLELYSGTRVEKAEEIKRDYLFKKVPGDQVRARNEAIANRDRVRDEQTLIKQRKARQHQLRIQYKQRQYENYKKESKVSFWKEEERG